jgi:hypothetical protein
VCLKNIVVYSSEANVSKFLRALMYPDRLELKKGERRGGCTCLRLELSGVPVGHARGRACLPRGFERLQNSEQQMIQKGQTNINVNTYTRSFSTCFTSPP